MDPEYCIIATSLCLPSSEWAAWIQAFGSVVAIVAAGYIAGYEGRRRRRDAIESAKYFAVLLKASADNLLTVVEHRSGAEFVAMRYEVAEKIVYGNAINTHALPFLLSAHLVTLKANALVLQAVFDGRQNVVGLDWGNIEKESAAAHGRIVASHDVVKRAYRAYFGKKPKA